MVNVLYEDNHIIVAYKPKGILSQADGSAKEDMLTILKDYIKEKYNKPGNVYLGLVHRLDINTSGVMVFARSTKAAQRLNEAIKANSFNKMYRATVEGIIADTNDFVKLENNITKNEEERKAYITEAGQRAILYYKVVKTYEISSISVSDIIIKLETGRFHQIRCQMANIGHPLYGDKKYGGVGNIDKEEFPLEAYSLSFPHPTTKEILTFTYPNK